MFVVCFVLFVFPRDDFLIDCLRFHSVVTLVEYGAEKGYKWPVFYRACVLP